MTKRYRPALAVLPLIAIALAGCSTVVSRPISTQSAASAPATPAAPSSGASSAGGNLPPDQNCGDTGNFDCTTDAAAPGLPPAPRSARTASTTVDPNRAGLTYFLPRQLVKVTAKRTNPTVKEAIAALGVAQKAAADAKKARAGLEADIEGTKGAIVEHADNIPVRDMLMADLKKLEAALPGATVKETTAEKAATDAADALASVSGGVSGSGKHSTMVIELLPLSGDARFGFRLDPKHSIFRDDKHKFELTPSGLLTSSDILAADRTADVLSELAFVAGLAFPGTVARGSREAKDAADACLGAPELVVAIVDLANKTDVDDLNDDVRCMGLRLTTNFNRTPVEGSIDAPIATASPGLFYRVGVEVPLRIEYCGIKECETRDSGWFLKETKYIALPQAGPISFIPQRAGFMTTTHYKLGFKDGVLVSYDSDRPSELLSVARVPGKLVEQVFGGASKIISLRTGYNDSLVSRSASDLATLQALARDQDTAETYRQCAAARRAAGESIAPCLEAID